jgi:hypothetical protein
MYNIFMNFKRLFTTPLGKILLSVILGLGLASLFRKVCTDKNCIHFKGAAIADIDGKTYMHDDKCYKYTATPSKCNTKNKIIDIGEQTSEKGNHTYV